MYNKSLYRAGYYNNAYAPVSDKILDSLIQNFFASIRILYSVVPILVVLNIIGITHIEWWVLAAVWFGWHVIDFLSDVLEIYVERYREKRTEKKRREARKEHQKKWLHGTETERIEVDEL